MAKDKEEIEKLFEDILREVLKKEQAERLPEQILQDEAQTEVPYEGNQI